MRIIKVTSLLLLFLMTSKAFGYIQLPTNDDEIKVTVSFAIEDPKLTEVYDKFIKAVSSVHLERSGLSGKQEFLTARIKNLKDSSIYLNRDTFLMSVIGKCLGFLPEVKGVSWDEKEIATLDKISGIGMGVSSLLIFVGL